MKAKLQALFAALLLAGSPMLAQATASCTHSAFGDQGAAPVLTVDNSGDLIVIFVLQTTGFVTSVSSSLSDTINASVIGAFNNSSSTWVEPLLSANVSTVYGYSGGSGTDTLTVHYSTSPSSRIIAVDCPGVAASSAIISNIYRGQSAPGTGSNAATVAGGTGSDTVGSQPAVVIGFFMSNVLSFTAGTGWTLLRQGSGDEWPNLVEYKHITSTGTFDATATASTTGSAADEWQIAFNEAGGGSTCTHAGYTSAGASAVPTAGSTSVFRPSAGGFGTVDCSSTNYFQLLNGAIGAN